VKNLLPVPSTYTLVFQNQTKPRPKRYLLRLINTSFDTTFVFSIDNHNLTIIGADFVPIHNYSNTSVLIGIGQRYHVVVEANPIANASQPVPKDWNFWMRTYVAGCSTAPNNSEYMLNGILRYDSSSTALPSSKPWNGVSLDCSDETYSSLKPVLNWTVGAPSNGNTGEEKDVHGFVNGPPDYPLAFFSLTQFGAVPTALRIDYSNITFLNLDNTGGWPSEWIITPENYKSTDWVSQSRSHSLSDPEESTLT
jgi:hypothetical protein